MKIIIEADGNVITKNINDCYDCICTKGSRFYCRHHNKEITNPLAKYIDNKTECKLKKLYL